MYQKVLALLDGSKLAECSLEQIKAVAAGCSVSRVILLTVVEPVFPDFPYTADDALYESRAAEVAKALADAQKKARERAEQYLAKVTEKLGLSGKGINVENVVISSRRFESPADVILNYVKKNKVDLIIMSTHGRVGIVRWALGSVTDRVSRHANCPVLTIPPAGCRV